MRLNHKILGAICLLVCVSRAALALELEFGNVGTGDGGHGWGVIAEYGDGGPGTLTITRNTVPGFPPPDYWRRWGRLCNLRVYDPEGFLMEYIEMGDQSEATKTYTVKLPEGRAGRYRFSMSGGLIGKDTFKFEIPDPIAWGVRGEKILNLIGDKLPEKMYMAFAPSSKHYYLTGNNVSWSVTGEEGKSAHGAKAVLAVRKEGEDILELTIDPAKKSMSLFCDGLPNTFSPTPEMAKRIMGGAVYADDGSLCEGPLQAKLWNAVLALGAEEDLTLTAEEIETAKKTMDQWVLKSYTNIIWDVKSTSFAFAPPVFTKHKGFDFYNYDHHRYAAGNYADMALANPENRRLLKRAFIIAFTDLARMDGAGILRQTADGTFYAEHGYDRRPLEGQRIDCASMFEIMAGLGRGCKMLLPLMPADLARVYREAVLDVCYKELGFLCYQSNQFMHIRECLNDVYCTVQDPHLGRCLKMELEAFMSNHFHGKHGQHPSGFFLEEYGPDGNYDQMSLRSMSVIYNTYRFAPGHDEDLVKKMKTCIEKNLHWRSLFDITDPANGKPYQLAFAMNHRTDGPTHFDSHGGLANLSNEFDMAYTMLKLGSTNAAPEKLLPLPYAQKEYCEELDGFTAVKRGGFYVMDFYKVYDEIPDGFLGPMFIWHEKAGLGLCGIKHSYGKRHAHWMEHEMEERDITFPTVFGYLDGKLFAEAKRMQKTFEWIEQGKSWKVTGVAYQPPKNRNAAKLERGRLSWTTDIVSENVIEMAIEADFADLKDATVNLPILRQRGRTVWSHEGWRESEIDSSRGRYVQRAPTGIIEITWPADVESKLEQDTPCTRGWCENLRLKLPVSGKVKVRYEAKGLE